MRKPSLPLILAKKKEEEEETEVRSSRSGPVKIKNAEERFWGPKTFNSEGRSFTKRGNQKWHREKEEDRSGRESFDLVHSLLSLSRARYSTLECESMVDEGKGSKVRGAKGKKKKKDNMAISPEKKPDNRHSQLY